MKRLAADMGNIAAGNEMASETSIHELRNDLRTRRQEARGYDTQLKALRAAKAARDRCENSHNAPLFRKGPLRLQSHPIQKV